MQIAQLGKYKLGDKLGQGAMGEVFRAHDPVLGRDVAIKVAAARLTGDEPARQRFLREARAAALLNHPNIVTIYDFGEAQGLAYIAMEIVEGDDLRNLIEKDALGGLDDKLAIMEQILDGLAFAHSKGVVHRDLKPGNIHVLPNSQIKVMDFGLAHREEDAAASGALIGTPYYMAPEQIKGQPASPRSDVFSLGTLFYELLSGKRPFTGPSIPAVLYAVTRADLEPLAQAAPDLPDALGPFVERALAKDPAARYADAGEMLNALRVAWAGGEPPEAGAAQDGAADAAQQKTLGPPPSASPDTPPELQAALAEIEDYLADRVPPLMVADSVTAFVGSSVEAAAAEIWAWALGQQQRLEGVTAIADLLFHALHKLSVIGELDLVESRGLLSYLTRVGAELEAALPPADRARFRRALRRLGNSEMIRSGPVETLRHVSAPLPSAPSPGLRRLSLLEQRLRRTFLTAGPEAVAAQQAVVSQAFAAAANEAKSEIDLENHLRRLRAAGVAAAADHVFRSLGQGLADWAIPASLCADTTDLTAVSELRAMKQIVSLPEDPVEVARRYRHLVTAATEQFNAGNLGGAVQMLELASKLSAEKKVENGYTEPLLKRGHEALDSVRIRQYFERPDRHAQLQSVMAFFEPGLGPEVLLDQVETEERRDRRRLLLDLLAVHGDRARSFARARLLSSLGSQASDFARRNWIYLLRMLPRPAHEPVEPEIDAVGRFASPGNPLFLVKEALLYLGHTHQARAAQDLVSLLHAWEAQLETGPDGGKPEDVRAALDRVASALARQGGAKAWAALVEHALSRDPKLGTTIDRLAELGTHDLSTAPAVIDTLAEAIREALPRGVLGRLVGRRDQDLPALVRALAGTRTPAVGELLEEVARRLPGQEAGRAATHAIESVGAPAAPAGVSGALEPYALPSLLHRLTEARSTGTLHLLPAEAAGGPPASLGLAQGHVVGAHWGQRAGLDAVYQLFERPFPGRYAFDPSLVPARPWSPLGDLQSIVVEGVRRARDLRRACAVVPADLPLQATGSAPGTVQDEPDYDLVVALWQKGCAGVPAGVIEAESRFDAFRVYRPLAQWLEEGALCAAEAAAEQATSGPGPNSSSPGT